MNIGFIYPYYEKEFSGINKYSKGILDEFNAPDMKKFCLGYDYLKINGMEEIHCLYKNENDNEIAKKEQYLLAKMHQINVLISFFKPILIDKKLKVHTVITIHDLAPLVNREWHKSNNALYYTIDVQLRESAHMSDKVIAVSEATKRSVIDIYGIPDEKIEIIYPAIISELNGLRISESDILPIKQKFSIRDGYVLSICTFEPRKNLISLVRAFDIYREKHSDSDIQLVLVGKLGWDYDNILEAINSSRYKEDIIMTGYVDDCDLGILYKGAIAFAYISYFEGFGAPILEALHYGKAVLASNTSSMPEVGGEAVSYCNPYDLESVYSSLENLLENKEYRQGLEKKAMVQAAKFSYKKSAQKLESMARDLC